MGAQRRRDDPARREEPGSSAEGPWLVALGGIAALVMICGLIWLGAILEGRQESPAQVMVSLVTGAEPFTATMAVVVAVPLAAAAGLAVWVSWRRKASRDVRQAPWVESKATSLAQPQDLGTLVEPKSTAEAERLQCAEFGHGMPVANLVRGGSGAPVPLQSSYEWVQAWIMGPRAGKTSCVAVRQICETSGPVVSTSNKRDVVDLTRGYRQQLGHTWVFDPQDLIGEAPTWWWNPLSYVTDLSKADELAALFANSGKDEGARDDAYFGPEGEAFLSSLLYAAALSHSQITIVWDWLTEPDDPTPSEILQMHGKTVAARAIDAIVTLAPGQRDGVVGTARKLLSWLRSEAVLPWITDSEGRPEFDPAQFVTTQQTLYLISREGSGSARAVTAALAVATMRAAEWLAGRSPGGRLPRPMPVVLDEAANVVRWRELPSLYSHFGSRGILLSTFFQSWSQGCAAFGKEGMSALWSASNVRVVGSGLAEEESHFLQTWSTTIGDHDVVTRDVSLAPHSRHQGILDGRRTVSTRLRRERIFEPSELVKMPSGYAVMVAAGCAPAVIRLVHWSQTPYKDTIAASERYYSSMTPGNASTPAA